MLSVRHSPVALFVSMVPITPCEGCCMRTPECGRPADR
jgi:hypothetical protein